MKYEYMCRCFAARDIAIGGMEKWLNKMGQIVNMNHVEAVMLLGQLQIQQLEI